jgi:glutamyl/glutaminyl-tRNA synthetase
MGPDGRKKLSKRDGAKDVLEYIREGFLPETLLNFMASLGWNDGTEQEVFSVAELVEKFSLDHVQHSGARFDEQRLTWMNGAHIRALTLDELFDRVANYWPAEAAEYDDTYRKSVLALVQERLKYLSELPALTTFFFVDLPIDLTLIRSHKQLSKLNTAELIELLTKASDTLTESDFSVTELSTRLNSLLETTGQKPAVLFSLIRIATTQAPSSPGLADSLAVIGKTRSLSRLRSMLASLSSSTT